MGVWTASSRSAGIALTAGVTFVSIIPTAGAESFQPQFKPALHVTRATGPILIDGELDDPGWNNAAVASNFAEVNPGDQVEPPVPSEARVTYDDVNLYVALIAYDDPATIRVSLRDRDNIFRDDYFGIMIDTYGELTWGYELFVNPYGIQGDLRILSDGNEEIAFDIVWESEGKVTDTGYQVEIAVPFASLRFPDSPEQTWRVNFWRDHQREVRRRYAWAATDRDDPCWMCQWGFLTGIKDIKPGRNLEIIANVVSDQSGALLDGDDPGSTFNNQKIEADASLNVRYGLSSNASTELAINPDFSQVESDAGQIDVNQTFALFFPERRPFFQEGSDQFNTWISTIYTRSINNPVAAGKLSGQWNKSSVSYTFARDENTPLILPFEEQNEFVALGKSISNILRLRQTIHEETYAGALVTDRRVDDAGSGTVLGVDANLRFLQNYNLEFQFTASHTQEPEGIGVSLAGDPDSIDTFDNGRHTADLDGESYWGHALYTSLERSGRKWNADLDYWEYSPTFRADNGFTTRNDYRQVSLSAGMFYRPNRGWLINWEPSLAVGRIWNYDNRFKDEWFRPNLYFRLKGQTDLTLQYLLSSERFSNIRFKRTRLTYLELNSRPSEILNGGMSLRVGQGIFRSFDRPELGDQLNLSAWGQIKPHERLSIEPTWNYAQMRSRIDENLLFRTYILRTRFNLNFTREWFLRFVVQYNDGRKRLDIEPLLTYRINPFTVFFVGYNSSYRNFEIDPMASRDPARNDWDMTTRQFFAKVQYLFRL